MPSRDLDDAGSYSGVTYALSDLLDVEVNDVLTRHRAKGVWDSFLFVVDTGRADDVGAGTVCQFCDKFDIPSQIHGARIDQCLASERLQFLQAVDRACHR